MNRTWRSEPEHPFRVLKKRDVLPHSTAQFHTTDQLPLTRPMRFLSNQRHSTTYPSSVKQFRLTIHFTCAIPLIHFSCVYFSSNRPSSLPCSCPCLVRSLHLPPHTSVATATPHTTFTSSHPTAVFLNERCCTTTAGPTHHNARVLSRNVATIAVLASAGLPRNVLAPES